MNIKYQALDSTWRWNIEKSGNHQKWTSNIGHWIQCGDFWWNITLPTKNECQISGTGFSMGVKCWKIGWWIASPNKNEHHILGTGFKMEVKYWKIGWWIQHGDFWWNMWKLGNELRYPLKMHVKYQAGVNIKLKYWKVLYICQLPVKEQLI